MTYCVVLFEVDAEILFLVRFQTIPERNDQKNGTLIDIDQTFFYRRNYFHIMKQGPSFRGTCPSQALDKKGHTIFCTPNILS